MGVCEGEREEEVEREGERGRGGKGERVESAAGGSE
jgi:hypothetical protein